MSDAPQNNEDPSNPPRTQFEDFSKQFQRKMTERTDKALDNGFKVWWETANDNKRLALIVLTAAVMIGPIGAGLFSTIKAVTNPTAKTEIMISFGWLFLITLPISAAAFILPLITGHTGANQIVFACTCACIGGAALLSFIGAPSSLGDLYCYANLTSNGLVYESQCRAMDNAGFVRESLSSGYSTPRGIQIIGQAFVLVADARGFVMAVCGVVAGLASGYLVRSEQG